MTLGEQSDERQFNDFRFAFDNALNLGLQKIDFFRRIEFERGGFRLLFRFL
jgi:hypothetical protein